MGATCAACGQPIITTPNRTAPALDNTPGRVGPYDETGHLMTITEALQRQAPGYARHHCEPRDTQEALWA